MLCCTEIGRVARNSVNLSPSNGPKSQPGHGECVWTSGVWPPPAIAAQKALSGCRAVSAPTSPEHAGHWGSVRPHSHPSLAPRSPRRDPGDLGAAQRQRPVAQARLQETSPQQPSGTGRGPNIQIIISQIIIIIHQSPRLDSERLGYQMTFMTCSFLYVIITGRDLWTYQRPLFQRHEFISSIYF